MTDAIGQVEASSELFFQLLGNTEADYRVAQTTTQVTDPIGRLSLSLTILPGMKQRF